jgi:hypothetical protein
MNRSMNIPKKFDSLRYFLVISIPAETPVFYMPSWGPDLVNKLILFYSIHTIY